jgi:hypothetical protein
VPHPNSPILCEGRIRCRIGEKSDQGDTRLRRRSTPQHIEAFSHTVYLVQIDRLPRCQHPIDGVLIDHFLLEG